MSNHLMSYIYSRLLRKRFIIETTFDILKNTMRPEDLQHRRAQNTMVHILSPLLAYVFKKINRLNS